MTRITRDRYFMGIALLTKERATCPRLQVGAILVKENRIIMSGYNGVPSGMNHCADVGCSIHDNHCIAALHAEANVLIQCSKTGTSTDGSILYVTHRPCVHCLKLIISAGVKEIVYNEDYQDKRITKEFLDQIKMRRY
jgi:dCMP deaminase